MKTDLIFDEFKKLSYDSEFDDSFSVKSIPDTKHCIGVSSEGYPKFFIYTKDMEVFQPNKLLNILSVEYNLPCTFIADDENRFECHYTVITLHSTEKPLQEFFIKIFTIMLDNISSEPTKLEIAIAVEQMVSIFSAMNHPSKKKVQGLWAELLVIERSSDPKTLINAWHKTPDSKYDFTMGRDKVEVKSTSGDVRLHHFSLEQVSPSENSRVIIASTIVRESASCNDGLSISGLCNKIFQRVNSTDDRVLVMRIVAETMGMNDIKKINDMHFDYCEASDSLKFYDANDVPRVDKSGVDDGVSGVGFESDLSGVVDLQSKRPPFDSNESQLFSSLYK